MPGISREQAAGNLFNVEHAFSTLFFFFFFDLTLFDPRRVRCEMALMMLRLPGSKVSRFSSLTARNKIILLMYIFQQKSGGC